MKNVLLLTLSLVLTNTALADKISCQNAKLPLTIDDMNSAYMNSTGADAILANLQACEEDLISGKVCFEGSIDTAAQILRLADSNLFEPAGELIMTVAKVDKKSQTVNYKIMDGPNDEVITRAQMRNCSDSTEVAKKSVIKQKREPIEKMSHVEMEKVRQNILSQLKDESMGEVFSYQMQLGKGQVVRQIKKTLVEAYIDDTIVQLTKNTKSEIQNTVNLLCYQANGCASKSGQKKLDRVQALVSQLLKNKNMTLISLDSSGMGTFGQAQGLAIHDAESNQVFIVMSGYAE